MDAERIRKNLEAIIRKDGDDVCIQLEKYEQNRIRKDKMCANQNQARKIISSVVADKNISKSMLYIRNYDRVTYEHSISVAALALIMGIELNLDRDSLVNLGVGAMLHDVGKVFIKKDILNKRGRLSDGEYEEIKKHCELGCNFVDKAFKVPSEVKEIIVNHHERCDGRGYPESVHSGNISLACRIISVADTYDALTSDRPYREAVSHKEALNVLRDCSGGQLDHNVVKLFCMRIAHYPLDTFKEVSKSLVDHIVKYNTFRFN